MSYTGNFPKFNKVGADGKEVYFGDPDTDGSFRFVESGGSIHLEERVLTVWTDLGDIVGGGGGGDVYNVIADGNVDFAATVNYVETAADLVLNTKNGVNGGTSYLIVKNTDVGAHSIAFTGVGIAPAEIAVPISASSYNVYTFNYAANGPFAQLISNDSGAPFPVGGDGDLTILNGQTVQLNNGDIKDYNNVDIQTGGVLEILDASNNGDLTEIYVVGTFNMDGEIRSRATEKPTFNKSGNTTNGKAYNLTITQANGGSGGNGGGFNSGRQGFGGGGTNGYGGGGGGGYATGMPSTFGNGGSNNGGGASGWDGNPYAGAGGSGGAGNSTQGTGSGGATGSNSSSTVVNGANGGSGGGSGGGGGASYYDGSSTDRAKAGGGGGGGNKGQHGGLVYLFSQSTITGTGIVNLSGSNGFNGGGGGSGYRAGGTSYGGGGGGGGGAGGSGGHLLITVPSYAFSIDVSQGTAGSGASAGGSFNVSIAPTSGGGGAAGNVGSTTVI